MASVDSQKPLMTVPVNIKTIPTAGGILSSYGRDWTELVQLVGSVQCGSMNGRTAWL